LRNRNQQLIAAAEAKNPEEAGAAKVAAKIVDDKDQNGS